MDVVATVAAVLVGIAFLAAGATKVAAGPVWPEQARGLGAPTVVIPILPWVEIAIGALLVAQVARRWTALAALVLLLAFTALILRRLQQGSRPPCACFGAWSATPIGAVHVVRNAVLAALAAAAML